MNYQWKWDAVSESLPLLLKGFEEVRSAPDPLVAAQMALLRVMHAVDMPDPGQLVRKLEDIASRPVAAAPSSLGEAAPATAPAVSLPWEALVEQVKDMEFGLSTRMEMQVRVVELSAGKLLWSQPQGFTEDLSREMRAALEKVTGQGWTVERCNAPGQPTLIEKRDAEKAANDEAVRRSPLVAAVFAAFPDAQEISESEEAAQFRGGRQRSQRR